ncbi:MAG: hypothetical protein WBC78_21985, partial [Candidatus Sulfotelmatobacter sp.]
MNLAVLLVLISLATPALAGVVKDVRGALSQNSFASADLYLKSYVTKNGVTGEYLEAYSWMARAALDSQQ